MIGLTVLVVTIYLSFIYHSVSILMIAITECCIMLLSFCYLIYQTRRISGKLNIPISVLEQGQSLRGEVKLNCTTGLPIGRISLKISCRKRGAKRGKTIRMNLDQEQFVLPVEEVGCFELELVSMRVYDLFGLFFLVKCPKGGEMVLVLPKLRTVPIRLGESVHHFYGDADIYDELRPGYDPAENFGVREFRMGDKLQSVHWKLSARTDTLMIRENSLPKACPVVLFLKDALPEEYSALSFSLMDAGCPHYVCWQSVSRGELFRARVDDEESFYGVLTEYMRDGELDDSAKPEEEYAGKYRGERYLRSFVLDRFTRFAEDEEVVVG